MSENDAASTMQKLKKNEIVEKKGRIQGMEQRKIKRKKREIWIQKIRGIKIMKER